jgi:hypothetical protein
MINQIITGDGKASIPRSRCYRRKATPSLREHRSATQGSGSLSRVSTKNGELVAASELQHGWVANINAC